MYGIIGENRRISFHHQIFPIEMISWMFCAHVNSIIIMTASFDEASTTFDILTLLSPRCKSSSLLPTQRSLTLFEFIDIAAAHLPLFFLPLSLPASLSLSLSLSSSSHLSYLLKVKREKERKKMRGRNPASFFSPLYYYYTSTFSLSLSLSLGRFFFFLYDSLFGFE